MADFSTTHKVLIGGTAVVVVGVIGYLLYQNYKKPKIADITPTGTSEKPLDANAFLSLFADASKKPLTDTQKKAFFDMYNTLSDKEKFALTDIVKIQIDCIKSNPTDPMKAFGCIAQGSQGLVAKYGEDTLKSVGEKSNALFKAK